MLWVYLLIKAPSKTTLKNKCQDLSVKITWTVETFSYDEKDKGKENKYLLLSEFQTSAQLQRCEKTENFEIFLSRMKNGIQKWIRFTGPGQFYRDHLS